LAGVQPEYFSRESGAAVPTAIYHAFDKKISTLTGEKLSSIKALGFSHIQISPIQHSTGGDPWYFKYQPKSYRVGNDYGTEAELKDFIQRAHSSGLKVIGDVVFNHLGYVYDPAKKIWMSPKTWRLALGDPAGIGYCKSLLRDTYSQVFPLASKSPDEFFRIFAPWSRDGWIGGALPQLNTIHPAVQSSQLGYLAHLSELGLDGFRFDAAGLIDSESMKAFSEVIPKRKWSYAEVVSTDRSSAPRHARTLPVTDYLFLKTLRDAFSFGGSLESLRVPVSHDFSDSVTFALNHDTEAFLKSGGTHGVGLNFEVAEDADLATQYLLARSSGVPLILSEVAEKPSIKMAVLFRKLMEINRAGVEFSVPPHRICSHCDDRTFFMMERGSEGVFIMNKSAESVEEAVLNVTDFPNIRGCYQLLGDDFKFQVRETDGKQVLVPTQGQFKVPKRSGLFLVKSSGC
jgi:hypothetical protein